MYNTSKTTFNMNKRNYFMDYEGPLMQIVEVQVECGFQLSGGGTGESGLPEEEM